MMKTFFNIIISIFLFGSQALMAQLPDIRINEFMAKNLTMNMDEDFYGFSDWIELYNAGATTVNLRTYYLSNDKNNYKKWKILQNALIKPGEYLIIWADEMNAYKNQIHSNFQLDGNGGFIGLYSSSGLVVDTVNYPNQKTDVSYGMDVSGEWNFFANPSIGYGNLNNGVIGDIRVAQPTFSVKGGVYSSPQVIAITPLSASSEIHYTLDGSKPLMSSPVYTKPIELVNTSVIRAVAFEDGLLPSRTETNTYIINEDISLPVFSISMNPEYFWDDEIGFYVEGTNGLTGSESSKGPSPKSNFNQNWRRPIHMEFFDGEHSPAFSLEGEVKVYGGWSRGAVFKSLALYPGNSLDYRLFNNKPFTDYNSFILRNSGNDWAGIKLRDATVQSLFINQFDVDLQANRPTVLFVNGEFWGVINIQEKINEDYMATNHGANKDSVDYIEAYTILKAGDFNHYNALKDFFNKNDLSDSANYEYVKTQIDVKECLNYFIMGIYAGHSDWIYNGNNNLRLWRPRTPDGKWRWLIYDTDASFMSTTDNGIEKAINTSLILRKLLDNEEARTYFINTFSTMLNTCLRPEKAVQMIDSLKTLIAYDMNRHVEKWKNRDSFGKKAVWMTPGADGYIQINDGFMGPSLSSYSQWESNFGSVKTIAQNRPVYLLNELRTYFDQGTQVNINFQVVEDNSGIVEVDGLKVIDFDSPAKFFTGQKFEVNAAAKYGYQFKEWQLSGYEANTVTFFNEGSTWNYLDNGVDLGTSWESIDFDDSNWKSGNAKFGYGDGNEVTTCEFGDNLSDKHITTYFRKEFTINDKNVYESLTMELLRDDGVVVYFNGEEILRDNMPSGEINYETYASSSIGSADETTFYSFPIPANKLIDGTNLIAVELHQVNGNSSDLGFDMSLAAVSKGGGEISQILTSQRFDYTISGNATLKAVFEPVSVENHLFINEVMADNISAHTDEFGNYSDWIEIYNNGDTPIDIGGMYISNDATNPKLCKISSASPQLTTVPANGSVVFYADKQAQLGALHLNMSLNKNGEQVCISEEIAGSIVIHDKLTCPYQIPNLSFGRYTDGSNNLIIFSVVTPNESNIYEDVKSITGIFINEVSSSNIHSGTDEFGEADDWIEIYNDNDVAFDIGGLFISDSENSPMKYKIPDTNSVQTTIPPKGYLVLWADGTPNQGILHIGFKLSNAEELVLSSLSPSSFEIVDKYSTILTYEDLTHGRFPDGADNIVLMDVPSISASNIFREPQTIANLLINEIKVNNVDFSDENGAFGDWIEIYNPGETFVDMGGLYLSDDITNPVKYRLPNSNPQTTTIQPHSYLVLWADANPTAGELHLGFSLNNSGEAIVLSQYTSSNIQQIDYKSYTPMAENMSLIRYTDGTESWLYTTSSTPAASNIYDFSLPVIDGLYINEVMASNTSFYDKTGNTPDWIEIYNSNSFAVDIANLFITDSWLEKNKYRIPGLHPDSTTIAPKSYLILWADNAPEAGILHLGFQLSSNGESIGLSQYTPNGLSFIDSLSYGPHLPDISFGRYPDGQALSQYFNLSTPGSKNKISSANYISGLYINEFMADNVSGILDDNGENEDWIEIYNSNNFSVDIGGLYLTDSLENLTLSRIPMTNPKLTTIPARNFILLWADKEPEQGVLHLNFKLNSSGEQIGLTQIFNNKYNVIDSLSYGEQNANISKGRIRDGINSWVNFLSPTPIAGNRTTSIAELSTNSGIIVFPNPSNGIFNIKINDYKKADAGSGIKVYNILGKTVFNEKVTFEQFQNGNSIQLDLSLYPKGVYTIRFGMYSRLIVLK